MEIGAVDDVFAPKFIVFLKVINLDVDEKQNQ